MDQPSWAGWTQLRQQWFYRQCHQRVRFRRRDRGHRHRHRARDARGTAGDGRGHGPGTQRCTRAGPPGRRSRLCVVSVNPRGPHHNATWRGSVQASQTAFTGASYTRLILISFDLLFAAISCSSWCRLPCCDAVQSLAADLRIKSCRHRHHPRISADHRPHHGNDQRVRRLTLRCA